MLLLMQQQQLDYTQTFVSLHDDLKAGNTPGTAALVDWFDAWQQAIKQADMDPADVVRTMASVNPRVIPRNHHMEAILNAVETTLSSTSADAFLKVLSRPYEQTEAMQQYQDADASADLNYQTFCGT